jgi:uncharacterized membrane protein (DUF441 family)
MDNERYFFLKKKVEKLGQEGMNMGFVFVTVAIKPTRSLR